MDKASISRMPAILAKRMEYAQLTLQNDRFGFGGLSENRFIDKK
jgi:hypothetical protein